MKKNFFAAFFFLSMAPFWMGADKLITAEQCQKYLGGTMRHTCHSNEEDYAKVEIESIPPKILMCCCVEKKEKTSDEAKDETPKKTVSEPPARL